MYINESNSRTPAATLIISLSQSLSLSVSHDCPACPHPSVSREMRLMELIYAVERSRLRKRQHMYTQVEMTLSCDGNLSRLSFVHCDYLDGFAFIGSFLC